MQTIASAAEELTASIRQISQQVSHISVMIADSVRQATMSNEQVKGLIKTAEKFGDVVRIISVIAGQTNLLALNVTIEAARQATQEKTLRWSPPTSRSGKPACDSNGSDWDADQGNPRCDRMALQS